MKNTKQAARSIFSRIPVPSKEGAASAARRALKALPTIKRLLVLVVILLSGGGLGDVLKTLGLDPSGETLDVDTGEVSTADFADVQGAFDPADVGEKLDGAASAMQSEEAHEVDAEEDGQRRPARFSPAEE